MLTCSLARLGNNCIAVVVLPVYNPWTGYATALLYDRKSLVQVFFHSMAAAIALGLQVKLYLGNMSAWRDWDHARDDGAGMRQILRQYLPGD